MRNVIGIGWVTLRARLYRPDRNPLRRWSDKIEAMFVAAFTLLFAGGLVLAPVLGQLVYQNGVAAERSGHWVTARLLADAPPANLTSYDGRGTAPRTKATWTGADGRVQTGRVPAMWGMKTGATTRAWVDASGTVIDNPPHRGETVARAIAVGLTTVLLTGGLLLGAFGVVRALLDRHRYAAWQAAWLTADRQWRRWKQT